MRKAFRPRLSSSTDRVVVGRVGKPHGLRGESTVLPDTDDPDRFVVGARFVSDAGEELTVAAVSPYRERGLIVRFGGVTSRGEAERLRGSLLTVGASDRRDLADDEYWPEDLAGLSAVRPDGRPLGTVRRVEFGPGQDRLVVRTDAGTDVLVPFVADIVAAPEGSTVVIDPPEGLFP